MQIELIFNIITWILLAGGFVFFLSSIKLENPFLLKSHAEQEKELTALIMEVEKDTFLLLPLWRKG